MSSGSGTSACSATKRQQSPNVRKPPTNYAPTLLADYHHPADVGREVGAVGHFLHAFPGGRIRWVLPEELQLLCRVVVVADRGVGAVGDHERRDELDEPETHRTGGETIAASRVRRRAGDP